VVTAPSVVSWDVNDLSIFALGDNSDLFQMTWNSVAGFSSCIRLGGNWTNYPPTAVSWGVNRMDIFIGIPIIINFTTLTGMDPGSRRQCLKVLAATARPA
jgi:hypothetical protein